MDHLDEHSILSGMWLEAERSRGKIRPGVLGSRGNAPDGGPGGKAPESSWILEHCSINLHGVIF
jgi:hypothetical protein